MNAASRLAAGLSCVLMFANAHATTVNDEGPYEGGVFERPVGEPYAPPPQEIPEPKTPRLTDEQGRSNDLVILFDPEDQEILSAAFGDSYDGRQLISRFDAEIALLDSINAAGAEALAYFHQPEEARFLIRHDRLEAASRELLTPDHPQEKLHRYVILRYASVEAALQAREMLAKQPGVLFTAIDRSAKLSWAPNDPYFPRAGVGGDPRTFQWGIHAMRFPDAWDRTKGHGYVTVIDTGTISGGVDLEAPPDIAGEPGVIGNYRHHFSFNDNGAGTNYVHGMHVLGIVGAIGNNQRGIVGACPTCSVSMGDSYIAYTSLAYSLWQAFLRGAQVINLSVNDPSESDCAGDRLVLCEAIDLVSTRDILVVSSAGNTYNVGPIFPASHPSVLSVAGAEWGTLWWLQPTSWNFWQYDSQHGSSRAGTTGVVAPARAIVSTTPVGGGYSPVYPHHMCGDDPEGDESGTPGDGYGSCTGTSMAAPHVAALAGILRSINPRLSRTAIADRIRAAGSHALLPNAQRGYGMPDARIAVDQTIAQTPNRLTPLFSMYSSQRFDYFYSTVPQMASVASWGTLRPVNVPGEASRYQSSGGVAISGYSSYPDAYPNTTPVAAAWIFTTPENPKSSSTPLVPLYRMSWKCGDPTPYPPQICGTQPNHSDTLLTADPEGVVAYGGYGYKLDGIEGYIYPKALPQPPGTVRLMRKYNPIRDDHAIFPEPQLVSMLYLGYTENSGSDWLGYVYQNTNGTVPAIQ